MEELSEEMRMAVAAYTPICQGELLATTGLVSPDTISVTFMEATEVTEQFKTARVRLQEQPIEPSVEVLTAPSP
jgi:hypothetical protein